MIRLVALALLLASPLAAQAQAAIDYAALREETARRLSEYIRINTSNPPGNELAAARWLAEVLAKEGIEGAILDTAELGGGRANFYARMPGTGGGKGIALVHHMDVVTATPKDWKQDPFAGTIKDGHVWGRGALDMKGHGIIQLMAFIALKRAGIPLTRELVYVGNADEEIGGLGSRTFVERHPDLVRNIEYVLTEGADTRVEKGKIRWFGIDVGEKRTWWKKLVVKGTTSHGSVPLGDNPVERLVQAVNRILAYQTPVRLTPAVDRFFKAQARDQTGQAKIWLSDPAAALKTKRGRAWLLGEPERNALLRATITPTVLQGSEKTNIIPQEASVELDIRLLPDEDTVAFRKTLERLIADPRVEIEAIGDMAPPYSAPLDTEMFRAIERVAGRLLPGVPIATPMSAGATDRPYWAVAGPICYGLDPYLVELEESRYSVHGNDERLSLENIEFGLKFYVETVLEMAGQRGGGAAGR
ncbi:MAG TPA: M20/M25/M40 family metallo-hydrolase [Gemmatimonadales bacterium]|jgi:acetylornithine deacetylase/succinyl-diaminopimelate desuccinylase-like protein|nr:M20/M25/M40 family metallo-hydrolase [Gemmatimonadales bacterium]